MNLKRVLKWTTRITYITFVLSRSTRGAKAAFLKATNVAVERWSTCSSTSPTTAPFCSMPPAKLPELPAEAHQKMVRLLARMLNEHLIYRPSPAREEVGDE
jgi:hypothetical protein